MCISWTLSRRKGRQAETERGVGVRGGIDTVRYINMRSESISVGCGGEGEERAAEKRE